MKNRTSKEAKKHLLDDISKDVRRTKYLYVDYQIPSEYGFGYFEPILIFFCRCDYLGALYTGSAKEIRKGGIGSTERSKKFIEEVLGQINGKYIGLTDDLLDDFRHRLVHTYSPKNFTIARSHLENHLSRVDGKIQINIKLLLDEMLKAIELYANSLNDDSENESEGSLHAFYKAKREIDES